MNTIRPYLPRDLADVYRVCLLTGAAGGDATGTFDDDDLLGDIFVGPYVRLEPSTAWVVDTGDHVAGYIVAVPDTRAFVQRYRDEWLPGFAERHPLVDPAVNATDRMVALGHDPERMLGPGLAEFPAHLHIDLLPELQGKGMGRQLMRTLLTELRRLGVPGVHLGVAEENTNARAFYRHLGFRPLPTSPDDELLVGIRTDTQL